MSRLPSLLLLAAACCTGAAHAKRPNGEAGQFDYYAVALSWSPSYCATRDDADQCSPGRQLGFVLHGLWPQFERGYPESCTDRRLPSDVRARYAGIYPSPKMIGHEWDKHGTCSGLEPAAYFELSDKLRKQLAIPAPYVRPAEPVRASYAEFTEAFRRANPALARDGVLPFCAGGGRFLREVMACYARDGRSRSCGDAEVKRSQKSCRQPSFLLQNVR